MVDFLFYLDYNINMELQIYNLIKSLNKTEQKQLLEKLCAINLATSVNRDPEFLQEAIKELGVNFPILEQFIERKAHEQI